MTFYALRSLRYDLDEVTVMPERTIILDRSGREMGRLHGENREVVPLSQVSPYFRKALLAREDARFYNHGAIDFKGLVRSTFQNIKRRRFAQGASTLTMQLARNSFNLSQGDQWYHELDRKFLEIAVSFRIENRYSKDEVLEHYINRIFWGHSMQGVEAASRAYFMTPDQSRGKKASELTLSEAAMLAGIIRGPNLFSPFKSIKRATRERDTVLGDMVKYELITQAEAELAKQEKLKVRPKHLRSSKNSYSMDAIRRDLDLILEEHNIELGGLTVITTIDPSLQQAAEKSVDQRLRAIEQMKGYRHQTRTTFQRAYRDQAPSYLQGAAVVIENQTGRILSMVGGRSIDESQFNRALSAKRQIGSLFKPFLFMAAYEKGLLPDTWISDDRIKAGEIDNSPAGWNPRNSDGKYYEWVKTGDALVKSRNTSSIRVGDFAGMDHVIKTAQHAGFLNNIPNSPASYLGAWEATPKEVASAYTVFPNQGTRYRPYLIEEIKGANGKTLYLSGQLDVEGPKVGAAWSVSSVLQHVAKRGTASNISRKLGFTSPCGGKTGTTDDYQDAWFAGYTSSITAAIWVGLDQPEKIINGGYGSKLAAPIWVDIMKKATSLGYPMSPFKPRSPSKVAELCRVSAKYATPLCRQEQMAYQARVPADLLPEKGHTCPLHPVAAQSVKSRRGFSTPPRAILVEPQPPRAIPVE